MALHVQIRKRLGDFLLDVHFSTECGRLALLGASGCGKSVTLRCIAGVMTPDEGRIELGGRVLFDSEKRINLPPQKRRVGYLFQQYALFPNMTVAQNIRAAIRDRRAREHTVSALLQTFHLEDMAQSRPEQLSGGQQQRLALARILATEPELLLLDEPFSALDSFLKYQLEQELCDRLEGFGGNVLWVSHDRDEVFRNCTQICVIDGGKSQPIVTPEALFRNPQTVAAAKLSGCKNLLRAVSGESSVFLPEWGVTLNCGRKVPAETIAVGLRAHHFRFVAAGEENTFRCRLIRVMDNVFSTIVLLRPEEAAANTPVLRLEMDKALWVSHAANTVHHVSIAPEDILLLKETEGVI